jgi:hypothetical protein
LEAGPRLHGHQRAKIADEVAVNPVNTARRLGVSLLAATADAVFVAVALPVAEGVALPVAVAIATGDRVLAAVGLADPVCVASADGEDEDELVTTAEIVGTGE